MKIKKKLLSVVLCMLVIGTCIPLTSAMSNNEKTKEKRYIQNGQNKIDELLDMVLNDENQILNFQSFPFLKLFIIFLVSTCGFLVYRLLGGLGGPYFPPGYHGR